MPVAEHQPTTLWTGTGSYSVDMKWRGKIEAKPNPTPPCILQPMIDRCMRCWMTDQVFCGWSFVTSCLSVHNFHLEQRCTTRSKGRLLDTGIGIVKVLVLRRVTEFQGPVFDIRDPS